MSDAERIATLERLLRAALDCSIDRNPHLCPWQAIRDYFAAKGQA